MGSYWGSIGIMEKKMETTRVYWGYIGFRILGLYWGTIRVILGFYRDNEKENGNYYRIIVPLN